MESTTQSDDRLTSLEKVVAILNTTSIGFSNSGVTYGTSRKPAESHMVTSALLEHEFLRKPQPRQLVAAADSCKNSALHRVNAGAKSSLA